MLYLPTTMFFNVIIWFCFADLDDYFRPAQLYNIIYKIVTDFYSHYFFGVVREQHFIPARFCIALNFIPLEI